MASYSYARQEFIIRKMCTFCKISRLYHFYGCGSVLFPSFAHPPVTSNLLRCFDGSFTVIFFLRLRSTSPRLGQMCLQKEGVYVPILSQVIPKERISLIRLHCERYFWRLPEGRNVSRCWLKEKVLLKNQIFRRKWLIIS